MANNSINISLQDTFESMVLTGKIGKSIWTGVISADLVNEDLVENEVVRQKLKRLIENLEEAILKIRLFKAPAIPSSVDYYKVKELSQQIYEIVAGGNVDVELYLIELIRKFDDMRTEDPVEFARINSACKKQMEQNRKTILSQNAVFAYPIFLEDKKEYSFDTHLIKEQEGKVIKKNGAEKLLAFIRVVYGKELPQENEMDVLDEINSQMLICDMLESVHSQSIQKLLNDTFLRNYLLRLGFTRLEIEDCDTAKLTEFAKELQSTADEDSKIFAQVFTDTMLTHIEYISVDKFVIAYLYRTLEEYKRSAQLSYDFEEIFAESRCVHELYKRVVNAEFLSHTSVSVMTVDGLKNISLRDMRKREKDFVNGLYLTPEILEAMKKMLFFKRSNLENCDADLINRLNCSSFEMEVISLVDFSNLEKFLELGKVNKLFLDRLVRNCSLDIYTELQERDEDEFFKLIEFPTTMELISYLFTKKHIIEKDLYEYYTLGEISLENIEEIQNSVENKEEFVAQIKRQIDDFDMFSRYKEYVIVKKEYEEALRNNSENVDMLKAKLDAKRKEKDRLLILYKKYKMDRTVDEKTEFLDENMLYFCIENEEEVVIDSLREMYKDSFLSLEDIEHLDSSYLQTIVMDNIFARGELNLEDTDKIKISISAEALKNIILNIIQNPNITRSQKFALIMNVYSSGTKEDLDISEELLGKLRMVYDGTDISVTDDSKTNRNKKRKGNTQTESTTRKPSKTTEWVYPKHIKWLFLRALDKDAEIKLYAGGYIEVNSEKLGVRIIEKYFEKDATGDDFGVDAYGHATFILSDVDYRNNIDKLVSQKACKITINGTQQVSVEEYMSRKGLCSVVDPKDRIHHNTQSVTKNWMREMAKYFNIDLETDLALVHDSRYTKEELEALRDVIKTYENAYVDRNAER